MVTRIEFVTCTEFVFCNELVMCRLLSTSTPLVAGGFSSRAITIPATLPLKFTALVTELPDDAAVLSIPTTPFKVVVAVALALTFPVTPDALTAAPFCQPNSATIKLLSAVMVLLIVSEFTKENVSDAVVPKLPTPVYVHITIE